jgi:tetratricopeptide (TPR) repeat protein
LLTPPLALRLSSTAQQAGVRAPSQAGNPGFEPIGCSIPAAQASPKEFPMNRLRLFVLLSSLSLASFCQAQTATGETLMLDLPRQSQHALLSQRIGITDITINYHRPLANSRQIWGKVVPYGEVWRAGANENTTIAFSDPVTIEGQSLDKGTYGLHMIPGENQWTVIFSKNSTSWGSFTYKQEEDALRVNIKPQTAELHDALAYDFDQLKPDSAVITMRWEKVAVPFKVAVKVNDLVTASIHRQLHGLNQYYWEGWDDAAGYFLANKMNLDEALKDEEQSIQIEERYDNLMSKSNILNAIGRKDEAAVFKNKALERANAVQLYVYGRQLQGDKKQDEAFALYRSNAKKYPDDWSSHLGLARVYSGQGDFDSAVKEMKTSLSGAPDTNKSSLENYVKRLQAKDDINR